MRTEAAHAPVGVFDSGIGGLSVLRALRAELPAEHFIYLADTGHAPYGERSDAFVVERSLTIAGELRARHGIKALVVACNTATAAAIDRLRAKHPGLPLVGVEPALKPAALQTRTGHVAVLATRGTLASARFAALHDSLRGSARFALVPCDGLAAAIEADDPAEVAALCARHVAAAGRFGTGAGQIDTLVLGCTHYPFAQAHFRQLLGPHIALLETGEPVARQARRLLAAAELLADGPAGRVDWLATGDAQGLRAAAARWLPGA